MSNQIVIAGNMLGAAEGLAYATAAGLDPERVLQSIGTGAAASFLLNALGPRMLKGDFAPGFMIQHFVKDMTIARDESMTRGLDLKGLKVALEQYLMLVEKHLESEGTQALIKVY
jgi:3-hydroxyisobutyrate dehydrogenase